MVLYPTPPNNMVGIIILHQQKFGFCTPFLMGLYLIFSAMLVVFY